MPLFFALSIFSSNTHMHTVAHTLHNIKNTRAAIVNKFCRDWTTAARLSLSGVSRRLLEWLRSVLNAAARSVYNDHKPDRSRPIYYACILYKRHLATVSSQAACLRMHRIPSGCCNVPLFSS